jgi:integrase
VALAQRQNEAAKDSDERKGTMRGSIKLRYKGKGDQPNSYRLIYDVRDPETGKRKRRWVTVRGTRDDADRKMTEILQSLNTHTYVDGSKMTLAEWLPRWLELAKSSKREKPLRASTISRYQNILDVRLLKGPLAAKPLQKITAADIEAYYASQKVSASTLTVDHAILNNAFRKAKASKLVTANPVADVEHRPRANRDERTEEAKRHAWCEADAARFMAKAREAGPQAAAFYALALDTGMRKSELGGLRWGSVDLEAGRVTVKEQLTQTGKLPAWGPTKGGRVRTIDIAAGTVALLKEHRRMQAELKMRNRQSYADFDLVFAKQWNDVRRRGEMLGHPLQLNNLGQREYAKLIRDAGVPRIKFHGLRHTCATLLLNSGEAVHNVSKRLGHKSVMMTMEVYAHLLDKQGKQMAATMGAILHG